MAELMPFLPDLGPDHSYTVSLEGIQYQVRLVYRARTRSWYLDLRDVDGVAILLGRRCSPGFPINAGLTTDGPPGWIVPAVSGDPFRSLTLTYYTAEEVAAQQTVVDANAATGAVVVRVDVAT